MGMSTRHWVRCTILTEAAVSSNALWAAACAGDGYSSLNFWVGNWKVSDPGGREIGTSKIELGLDGCQLTETWLSGAQYRGSNVHAYSGEDRRWHQLNVDNRGHVHAFAGAPKGRGLEYSGTSRNEAGQAVLHCMEIVLRRPLYPHRECRASDIS